MSPKAVVNMYKDKLVLAGIDATDEQTQFVLDASNGVIDLSTVSDEQFIFFLRASLALSGVDPFEKKDEELLATREHVIASINAAKEQAAPSDDAAAAAKEAARKAAEDIGIDYDVYARTQELMETASASVYINLDN